MVTSTSCGSPGSTALNRRTHSTILLPQSTLVQPQSPMQFGAWSNSGGNTRLGAGRQCHHLGYEVSASAFTPPSPPPRLPAAPPSIIPAEADADYGLLAPEPIECSGEAED